MIDVASYASPSVQALSCVAVTVAPPPTDANSSFKANTKLVLTVVLSDANVPICVLVSTCNSAMDATRLDLSVVGKELSKPSAASSCPSGLLTTLALAAAPVVIGVKLLVEIAHRP